MPTQMGAPPTSHTSGASTPPKGRPPTPATLSPVQRLRQTSRPEGATVEVSGSGSGAVDSRVLAYSPTRPGGGSTTDTHWLSLHLRHELRSQDRNTLDDDDSQALCKLLNAQWHGLELRRETSNTLLNAYLMSKMPQELRPALGRSGQGSPNTSFAFVAQLVTVKAATDVVQGTIKSAIQEIPCIGLVVRVLEASIEAAQLASLEAQLTRVNEATERSIGAIERLVFEGAGLILDRFKDEQIAATCAASAKVLIGLAPGGSTGSTVVTWLIKTAFMVRDVIRYALIQNEVNDCLNEQTLTYSHLKVCPELCLYLPFVPGIDVWVLLGVLPPEPAQIFLKDRKKWEMLQNRVFSHGEKIKTKDGSIDVWLPSPGLRADQERVDWILETCNKTLSQRPIRLVKVDPKTKSSTPYLNPLPVGFVEKMKAGLKERLMKTPGSVVQSILTSSLSDVALSYPEPTTDPSPKPATDTKQAGFQSDFSLIDLRTGQPIHLDN